MSNDVQLVGDLLIGAQLALQAHLTGVKVPSADNCVRDLFDVCRTCGLTDKEITQALLLPVRAILRPPLEGA